MVLVTMQPREIPASRDTSLERYQPRKIPASQDTSLARYQPREIPASRDTSLERYQPREIPASRDTSLERYQPREIPASRDTTFARLPAQLPCSYRWRLALRIVPSDMSTLNHTTRTLLRRLIQPRSEVETYIVSFENKISLLT